MTIRTLIRSLTSRKRNAQSSMARERTDSKSVYFIQAGEGCVNNIWPETNSRTKSSTEEFWWSITCVLNKARKSP